MADVVCWVLDEGDRVRVTWSAGPATFPPYFLDRPQRDEVESLAHALVEGLDALSRQHTPPAALELARAGYRLHQLLFHPAPAAVRGWWDEQRVRGTPLRVVGYGNLSGLWHLLYDQAPDEAAFLHDLHDTSGGACWEPFWGVRHELGDGGRVDPFAGERTLIEPRLLLAADDALPNEFRGRLAAFADTRKVRLVGTGPSLRDALETESPDLLAVFGAAGGTLVDARLYVTSGLAAGLDPPWHTLPQPSVSVRGPVPAPGAGPFLVDFLDAFLYRGESAGAALRRLRRQFGLAGLAFTSSLPPALRVRQAADTAPPPVPEAAEELPLPALPYRPLQPCTAADRALFVGRDEETLRLSALVDDTRTGLVLLHGPTGAGKTSLLQAGVLPFLELDCPGFWALRDQTDEEAAAEPLVFRATGDLAGQLAQALVRFCARPIAYETPAGETVEWDGPAALGKLLRTTEPGDRLLELRDQLRDEPAFLGTVLRALVEELPWQLLVVVDQGEDLIALADEDGRADGNFRLLKQLAAEMAGCTVILALRTDALGEVLAGLGPRPARGVPSYRLAELDEERLVQALLWPTASEPVAHAAQIPGEVYDFLFEEGLAETIVREALNSTHGQGGTLPLLQTLCDRLYRRLAGRPDRVIREDDLKKVGGVTPALRKYYDAIVTPDLRRGERRAIGALLEELCGRLPDGTRFTRPVRWDAAELVWQKAALRGGGRPFDEVAPLLTGDDARLLRAETLAIGGKEHAYVSVAHEALAEVAEGLGEQARAQKTARSRVADTLWIMIPLTVLVASLVYTLTSRAFSQGRDASADLARERAVLTELLDLQRYQAMIGQSEQALRGGNALRARQLLKEATSFVARADDEGGRDLLAPLDKLRGFEWYYLWNQVNGEKRTIPGFLGTYPSIALSADGKTLAVGGAAAAPPGESKLGVVKLFDAATGAVRGERRLYDGPVVAVALSADGKVTAAADEAGIIRLWRDELAADVVLREHEGAVNALAFAADGKTLASGGADGKVILWDVADGKKRKVLTEHVGAVLALAYSPKEPTLASAAADGTVILWDAAAGKKRSSLKGHAGAVNALAFTRDGKTLVSGGARPDGIPDQGEIRLWDVAKGGEKAAPALRLPEVFALAFGADDNTLYVGGKDNGVWAVDLAKTTRLGVRNGHFGWVRHLLVSTDAKTLVTASYDRTAKVWDVEAPPAVLRGEGTPVQALAFADDGKTAASGDRDGNTFVWDLHENRPRQKLQLPKARVAGVALLHKGKYVVTAAWDPGKKASSLTLWTAADGKVVKSLPAHAGEITCLALSPDGKTLASGGTDQKVQLWRFDAEKFTLERGATASGHSAAVRSVAFSPGGVVLVTGGDDETVRYWDPDTAKPLGMPRHDHTGSVLALAVGLDRQERPYITSAGTDRTIWIVRPPTDKQDQRWRDWTWRGLSAVPLALAYSSDRRTLAVAGADRCVTLWDVEHDEPRLVLTGHTQPVSCLAFAPDGRTLLSGGLDGDVRVWRGTPK